MVRWLILLRLPIQKLAAEARIRLNDRAHALSREKLMVREIGCARERDRESEAQENVSRVGLAA